jgi:hypothetical protein
VWINSIFTSKRQSFEYLHKKLSHDRSLHDHVFWDYFWNVYRDREPARTDNSVWEIGTYFLFNVTYYPSLCPEEFTFFLSYVTTIRSLCPEEFMFFLSYVTYYPVPLFEEFTLQLLKIITRTSCWGTVKGNLLNIYIKNCHMIVRYMITCFGTTFETFTEIESLQGPTTWRIYVLFVLCNLLSGPSVWRIYVTFVWYNLLFGHSVLKNLRTFCFM